MEKKCWNAAGGRGGIRGCMIKGSDFSNCGMMMPASGLAPMNATFDVAFIYTLALLMAGFVLQTKGEAILSIV
jgi:hypothetical protein